MSAALLIDLPAGGRRKGHLRLVSDVKQPAQTGPLTTGPHMNSAPLTDSDRPVRGQVKNFRASAALAPAAARVPVSVASKKAPLVAGARRATAPRPIALVRPVRLLLGALAAGAVLVMSALVGTAFAPQPARAGDTVLVQPGDSLWSIARAHTPAGTDTRDTLAAITALNGLSSQAITPGQSLVLPAN